MALERQEKLFKEEKKRTTVFLSESVHDELKSQARETGMNLSSYVAYLVLKEADKKAE